MSTSLCKPEKVIMSSRVRLARNYRDLPFDLTHDPEQAENCVRRTVGALQNSGSERILELVQLAAISQEERRVLLEDHRISADLLGHVNVAAVLIDRVADLSVMMNEEDHLRIQAVRSGMNLPMAADACFEVEDALSRQLTFAFDRQMGYLTACPANTGTGLRASLLLHLPSLTAAKQMGTVGQIAAKVGLTIRGVYGEGSEALGHIYQLSNQVTLGRTEREIITTVSAVGRQLAEMELEYRQDALLKHRAATEDSVFRAWGVMTGARLMRLEEFYRLWSAVRMGAALGLVPVSLSALDQLLTEAQEGHIRSQRRSDLSNEELRATHVRQALSAARPD